MSGYKLFLFNPIILFIVLHLSRLSTFHFPSLVDIPVIGYCYLRWVFSIASAIMLFIILAGELVAFVMFIYPPPPIIMVVKVAATFIRLIKLSLIVWKVEF